MTLYNFGLGSVIGRRTDVTGAQPSFFGTIQDCSIDIDQALVELYGQLKMAVDIAPSKLAIKGKAKFARIQLNQLNNMIMGNTVTTASGFDMSAAEAKTSGATFTVSKGATFIVDLGVFYHATGIQLTPTTATPTVGFYVPGVAGTGTYTLSGTADTTTAMDVYYTYTVTTLNSMIGTNNFMGTGPIFELDLSNHYTNNLGTVGTTNMKLNACRATKFTFPFQNIQYTIPDFEFQAFADASGVWGTVVTSE